MIFLARSKRFHHPFDQHARASGRLTCVSGCCERGKHVSQLAWETRSLIEIDAKTRESILKLESAVTPTSERRRRSPKAAKVCSRIYCFCALGKLPGTKQETDELKPDVIIGTCQCNDAEVF